MVRERVIWVSVALVLAPMAASLWEQAMVAALGAGILSLYALVAAIRGRCLGGVCAMPAGFAEGGDCPAED